MKEIKLNVGADGMTYQPIENYGIIGNAHSAALVGMNGSIDWFCFPHLDSPTVFAALLDDKKGGRFQITPASVGSNYKQHYWPDTNVLVTRFLSPDGVAEIEDFMPVVPTGKTTCQDQIVRRVKVVRGTVHLEMVCSPSFDYARVPAKVSIIRQGAVFE